MYGCNHSIGCLSVSAWRADKELSVRASRADFSEEKDGLEVSACRIGGGLRVSAGIACSVNKDEYIRFKDSLLVWYDQDNNEGIIKYNTLVASGKWSLEEVEIEELL